MAIAGPREAAGRRQADLGAGQVSPPLLVPPWLQALPRRRRNLRETNLKKIARVRGTH